MKTSKKLIDEFKIVDNILYGYVTAMVPIFRETYDIKNDKSFTKLQELILNEDLVYGVVTS